jgi:hypothetical protein
MTVNASGQLAVNGTGSSTNALSTNTWYFIEYYNLFGTANTLNSGAAAVQVNGVNWLNAPNATVTGGSAFAAPSFNFDNEFSGSNFDFGPWYLMDPGTAAMSSSLSLNGNMYFITTKLPVANDVVQFTPNTGTNFSNVNSIPSGANYNSDNTVSQKDTYNMGNSYYLNNPVGVVISTKAEVDAATGPRVSLPVWKNAAGTAVTGSIGTGAALVNGTYNVAQDGRLVSPFTGLPFTPAELAGLKAGIVVQD